MKKQVLIVEDDKFFRYAMKKMIQWEQYDLELAGEAVHGKAALEFLREHPVEIILTDMDMPVMNGIELTREVKEIYPGIMIIALSAYDDFEFVRESMRLGASDYILKQNMEEEDVGRVIVECWEKYMKAFAGKSRVREGIMETLKGHMPALTEEAGEYLRFCLDEKSGWYICVIRNLEEEWKNPACRDRLWLQDSILEFTDHKEHVIFFRSEQTAGMSARKAARDQVLHRIEELIKEEKYAAGCSERLTDPAEIRGQYGRIVELMECGRFSRRRKITTEEDADMTRRKKEWIWSSVKEEGKQENRIHHMDEVRETLEQMLEECRKNRPDEEHLQKCFLVFLNKAVDDLRLQTGNLEFVEFGDRLSRLFLLEDRKEAMESYIEEQLRRRDAGRYHQGVQQSMEFMEQNYDQTLTLKEIAGHAAMNETYFSNLFKKETGTGVVDYLNRIRIREAKRLLMTTNAKNYEIGEKVGFPNASYFSTIFKKETGMTIQEFRRSGEY